jgi:hypothetical protein
MESWSRLFERATAFETDEAAVRATLDERRAAGSEDGEGGGDGTGGGGDE